MFHPIGWCSTMFHDVPRHLSILIFYNIFLIIFYSCEMLWRDMKGFLRSLSKEWRSSLQAPLIYWVLDEPEASCRMLEIDQRSFDQNGPMQETCFLSFLSFLSVYEGECNQTQWPFHMAFNQSCLGQCQAEKWLQWLPATSGSSGRVGTFYLFEL